MSRRREIAEGRAFRAELPAEDRATSLNYRASAALDGDSPTPVEDLIELFRSDVPIERQVRERLALALECDEEAPLTLRFVGAGPHSTAGLIEQRRDWLELAEAFEKSGLSEPDFLATFEHIEVRQRTRLQDAKRFDRVFKKWLAYPPPECAPDIAGLLADEEDEEMAADNRFMLKRLFAEWAVENGLTNKGSILRFLQDG